MDKYTVYHKINENEENDCVICFEELNNSTVRILKQLNCKHTYHSDCLYKWSVINNVCPLCISHFDFDTDNIDDFRLWMKNKIKEPKPYMILLIEIIDTTVRVYDNHKVLLNNEFYINLIKRLQYYKQTELYWTQFFFFCRVGPKYKWYKRSYKKLTNLELITGLSETKDIT